MSIYRPLLSMGLSLFILNSAFGMNCKQAPFIALSKNRLSSMILRRSLQTQSTQRVIKSPETVDFNVNGVCNLDCKWCWGPVHNAQEDVTLSEWKNLAYNLKRLGTKSIVFTGGEALLKKGLPELVRYVKTDLGLRTTLSSNGLLMLY